MLSWSTTQFEEVQAILDRYPPESNNCAFAAQEVLPHAVALDVGSRAMLIEPPRVLRSKRMKGPYLVPREGTRARYWTHHVTVEVDQHYLDSLTRAQGHLCSTYLESFFEYAEILCLSPVEEDQWEEL